MHQYSSFWGAAPTRPLVGALPPVPRLGMGAQPLGPLRHCRQPSSVPPFCRSSCLGEIFRSPEFSSRVKYAYFWIIPECPKTQCRIGGRKIYYRSRRTLYLKSEWLCKITTANLREHLVTLQETVDCGLCRLPIIRTTILVVQVKYLVQFLCMNMSV